MRLLTRRADGNLYLADGIEEISSMFIVNPFTNYEVTSALRFITPHSDEELVIVPIYEDNCDDVMLNLLSRGLCDASDKCLCVGLDAVVEMRNGVPVEYGDKEEAERRIAVYEAEHKLIASLLTEERSLRSEGRSY